MKTANALRLSVRNAIQATILLLFPHTQACARTQQPMCGHSACSVLRYISRSASLRDAPRCEQGELCYRGTVVKPFCSSVPVYCRVCAIFFLCVRDGQPCVCVSTMFWYGVIRWQRAVCPG